MVQRRKPQGISDIGFGPAFQQQFNHLCMTTISGSEKWCPWCPLLVPIAGVDVGALSNKVLYLYNVTVRRGLIE